MTAKTRLVDAVKAVVDPVTGGIDYLTTGALQLAANPILVPWNGVDDTAAIDTAISTAGANGSIAFRAGKTYLTRGGHELLAGQTVFGNGAVVKKMPQVTSVLNTGVTYSTGATSVAVANPERFVAGMWVNVTSPLSALTAESTYYTDATKYKQTAPARVLSVVGNTVTVDRKMDVLTGGSFTLSAANGALLAENGNMFFAGLKLWSDLAAPTWATLPTNISLYNLVIDGDRLNNTEGAWWNVAGAITINCHYLTIDRCTIQNWASDAVIVSGKSTRIRNCHTNVIDGNGFHPSSFDGTNGTEDYQVVSCSARDVLKTYKRGHGDGAFIFSNNNYEAKYIDCHVDTCLGHAFGSQFNSTDSRFVLAGCTAKSASGGLRLSDGAFTTVSNCIFTECRDETVAALPNGGKPCSVIRNTSTVQVNGCTFNNSPLVISGTVSDLTVSGNSFYGAALGAPAGAGYAALVHSAGDGAKGRISHSGNTYHGPASAALKCLLVNGPTDVFSSSGNTYYQGDTAVSVQGASIACRIHGDVCEDQYTNGIELRPTAAGAANWSCSASVHFKNGSANGGTWIGVKIDNHSADTTKISVRGCDIQSFGAGATYLGINTQGASKNLNITGNTINISSASGKCIIANTNLDASSVVAGNIMNKAFADGVGTAVVTGLTADIII